MKKKQKTYGLLNTSSVDILNFRYQLYFFIWQIL